MEHDHNNERVKDLRAITARHRAREIEGCTSWRHRAVHKDREWLLDALENIRIQVEKVRSAAKIPAAESALEAELDTLLRMFETEKLNHIGD